MRKPYYSPSRESDALHWEAPEQDEYTLEKKDKWDDNPELVFTPSPKGLRVMFDFINSKGYTLQVTATCLEVDSMYVEGLEISVISPEGKECYVTNKNDYETIQELAHEALIAENETFGVEFS